MRKRRHLLTLLALAALLILGLGTVFQRRLARDLYPAYSSFRADQFGTRALHDALDRLPDRQTERSLRPLNYLDPAPARTILFLGADRHAWNDVPAEEFAALDRTLRAGSRIVLVLAAENYAPTSALEKDAAERAELKRQREAEDAEKRPAPDPTESESETKEKKAAKPPKAPPVDALAKWGCRIGIDRDHEGEVGAGPAAANAVPEGFNWGSDLFIEPDTPEEWNVFCERDGRALFAERHIGRGTLVIATDAFLVSNESIQRARATRLLTLLLGDLPFVVFEETHLGVAEDPGIAALARRYGLMPAFALCGLLAGLFVWRLSTEFVPPPPSRPETTLDYQPTTSLSALLRRAIPAPKLVPTCLEEWRRSARNTDHGRADSVAPTDDPVSHYNLIVAALRRRNGPPNSKH